MKITKSKLKEIIREEAQLLTENQNASNLLKKFKFPCNISVDGSDERTLQKIFNPKSIQHQLNYPEKADWTLIDVYFPYGDPAFIDKQVKKAKAKLVNIIPQFTVR
jgi:hypothetical protein